MLPRYLVHALLSLLLLVSQQMAFGHAMSHWSALLGGGGQGSVQGKLHAAPLALPGATAFVSGASADNTGSDELSRSLAQDPLCSQCLAFAQLASFIGSTAHPFPPADLLDEQHALCTAPQRAARTVCVFRSRAPPFFA